MTVGAEPDASLLQPGCLQLPAVRAPETLKTASPQWPRALLEFVGPRFRQKPRCQSSKYVLQLRWCLKYVDMKAQLFLAWHLFRGAVRWAKKVIAKQNNPWLGP